jgi:hypothetical protein
VRQRVLMKALKLGYGGGYDAVRRYARSWSKQHASATADAYVPLTFASREAYQFDWSHEIVVLDGVTTIVKVVRIPRQSGQGFRFDVGHRSDLIPATIPN